MGADQFEDVSLLDAKSLEQQYQPRRPARLHSRRHFTFFSGFRAAAIVLTALLFTLAWRKTPSLIQECTHHADVINNEWDWPERCQNIEFSRDKELQFEKLSDFEFSQVFERDEAAEQHGFEIEQAVNYHSGFYGHIHLLPANENQEVDILAKVSINSTNSYLADNVDYDTSESSLSLTLPSPWRRYHGQDGELCVRVSLYVKKALELKSLSLSASSSHITTKGLDLSVGNTTIYLNSGRLTASPFFQSRETRIALDAGSLSGEYNLYDLLAISTTAGSISASVIPQTADKTNPRPAIFQARSVAGSIDVKYPPPEVKDIPERDYETIIANEQGRIQGTFLHGRHTSFQTRAGSLQASILPYQADATNSSIESHSQAGRQEIELLSPHKNPGTALKNLFGTFITGVSSLDLKYPPEWEGKIDGEAKMGRLSLKGNGLEDVEEGSVGFLGRYVRARKGNGEGKLLFRTDVGSASVVIG